MIAGVILAAGRSSRMGRPKALLPYDAAGTTFLSHLGRTLRDAGVADVFVIGRTGDAAVAAEAERLGLRFVANPSADDGQLSSVLAGVDAIEAHGAAAMVMVPVDVPRITPASVVQVIDAWRASGAPVVRATWRGRHGHPVLFGREAYPDLRAADPAVGARAVVRALGDRVVNVEVEDPGVVEDVDTPDDYVRLFGRLL